MKIITLKSENVKRLHAVEITPNGSMVVIGGKNGQGKSSVLDSIEYALGGGRGVPMPVHAGEDKAIIVVDLGDIVVRRTFTADGGTSLVVTNADGIKQGTPQTILDKLAGRLTFDPLEFSRQKPAEQAQTLRQLVGLDFAKLEAERKALFDERTNENRKLKEISAQVQGMTNAPDKTPDTEQSVAQIVKEQSDAIETNRGNEEKRRTVREAHDKVEEMEREASRMNDTMCANRDEITRLQALLETQKTDLEKIDASLKALREKDKTANDALKSLVDIDLVQYTNRLNAVEKTNADVRLKKSREEAVKKLRAQSTACQNLTDKIEKLDADQKKATTSAKYPIPGLSLEPQHGIVINGIPLEQASSADKLKLSVAIGLALNPTLKVLLIRDGALLDSDSVKTVAEMAAEAGAQIWMERVGTDESTSVVIEDGCAIARQELNY